MGEVRNPIKKTSIEKKKRIIEKGFELMCNNGYHNVNCIDIAKYAGVSTGIIYQYFHDKKEIFLEGIRGYSDKIIYPMFNVLETDAKNKSLETLINDLIEKFIETHTISHNAHEELMAISHTDEDVASIFREKEWQMTKKIMKFLIELGFAESNLAEKVHVAIGLIENYCHEIVYHHHDNLDYVKMKKYVIDNIVYLLKEN